MLPKIIIGNQKQSQEYINKICSELSVDSFDITNIDSDSIGIADIRSLQSSLSLTPRKGEYKACVIRHADKITPEAQNALLKTLEEPPLSTLLFLISPTEETFLPTILSRCLTIKLENKNTKLTLEELEKLQEELQKW
jgi:DNA polymerase-3 subunit delta'